MAQKFVINVDVAGVGSVNVPVAVPILTWSVLTRFHLNPESALVTILTLGIVDIPADLLRMIAFSYPLAPLSNLDFLVRVPTGTVTITGFITGFEST